MGGRQHSLMLTEGGNLWTFGNNVQGQCAQGNEWNIKRPTIVKKKYFANERLLDISAGLQNSAVICSNGFVYLFGWNNGGQCGVSPDQYFNVRNPQILKTENNKNVIAKSIDCGNFHCLCISTTKQVYAWGRNGCYQLGIGSNEQYKFTPSLLKFEENVIDIACGYMHSLCVTEDVNGIGTAWSWGSGKHGRLGHGNESNQSEPKQIKLKNVSFIKCFAGWEHSALIDSNYNLYTFGEGKYGQLCHWDYGIGSQSFIGINKVSNMKVLDASLGSKYTILIEKHTQNNDEKKEDEVVDEVKIWLCDELKLPSKYFKLFIDDGFDEMDVIMEALGENDLMEMGNETNKIKKGHRKKILLSIKRMKQQRSNENNDEQIEGGNDVVYGNIQDTAQ